jgi:hypothetical protein
MILLKDLLKEMDLANQTTADKLARWGRYPLTPEIAKILSKNRKITAFHITSPDRIKLLKSIENTPKSISVFSEIANDDLEDMSGIRTEGGLIFYVEGLLVLKSLNDLRSQVDETGMRWVDVDTTLGDPDYPTEFVDNWNDYIKSNMSKVRSMSKVQRITRSYYVEEYKKVAKKFTELYSEDIIEQFAGVEGQDGWDEIIINNIKLIDCIYDISKVTPDIIKELQASVFNEPIGIDLKSEEGIKTLNKFITSREGQIRSF